MLAAWVAVIVTVPAFKIFTLDPDILAMVLFELLYENAPELFEDGLVRVKVTPLEYV